MSKSHTNIQGWTDFESAYTEAATHFNSGVFVEVGVYLGRGTVFLASEIKRLRKNIRVVGVDTFRGTGVEGGIDNHSAAVARGNGSFIAEAYSNLKECGVSDIVDLLAADSVRAASYFADSSLEMVFLDARHDEASVAADIAAWLPKVKSSGWLCGDDLCPIWPGVEKAVAAALPGYTKWSWDSWRYIKP
jgi:predicted O-methyltransferase YrrM